MYNRISTDRKCCIVCVQRYFVARVGTAAAAAVTGRQQTNLLVSRGVWTRYGNFVELQLQLLSGETCSQNALTLNTRDSTTDVR